MIVRHWNKGERGVGDFNYCTFAIEAQLHFCRFKSAEPSYKKNMNDKNLIRKKRNYLQKKTVKNVKNTYG